MIEHVAEIGARLGVDPGQVQAAQLGHHLTRRREDALEADQLAADLEDATDLVTGEEIVHRPLLHGQHLVLKGVAQRQIAVDDEVEDRVEDIVDAVAEQRRRRFELGPQVGMAAARGAADADDVAVADEDGGLAVADGALLQPGRPGHHEDLVAEDIQLGQLLALGGVFDCKRVETVAVLECLKFLEGRIDKADPDELRLVLGTVDALADGHAPDPLAVLIEIGGDNAHGPRPTAERCGLED